jgi:hypothetical protein
MDRGGEGEDGQVIPIIIFRWLDNRPQIDKCERPQGSLA